MSISLEEAKALMTDASLEKLREVVTIKPIINMDRKTSSDILMQALCKGIEDGVIHESSLNGKIIKLLNAETSSIAQAKLGEILMTIQKHQPKMACVISLKTGDMSTVLYDWVFRGPEVRFNAMFEYVVRTFHITPGIIRDKLSQMLKPTIANNIAQFLSKYESMDDPSDTVISITTITRLVNMENHLLIAEFKEL